MHNDIQYRGVELKLPASVDIDAVVDSYYIESFLEDNKVKFFTLLLIFGLYLTFN